MIGFAAVALAAAGCGSSEDEGKLSDAKVESALNIQKSSTGLQVGSNAFCAIDRILNDSDEVSGLKKSEKSLAIVAKGDVVGVVVITPFAKACQRQVLKDLNALARKTQKKS